MNKTWILVLVLAAIVVAIILLERPDIEVELTPGFDENKEELYAKAPDLAGIAGYINTPEGTKLSDFQGKVVLVDFWTYTCINCIRTLPHLVEWHDRYADKGLVIVGVHSPEFGFEKKYENVLAAVEEYGIEYPVVQDNDFGTWRAYKNRYWPHKFLIDADGYIRYDHIGEGKYDETEMEIQKLLGEIGMDADMPLSQVEDKTPRFRQTPELYAGFKFALPRGQNVANNGGMRPNLVTDYELPDEISSDRIYLTGSWLSLEDELKGMGTNPVSIVLSFSSNGASIVARNTERSSELEVFIDGEYISTADAGDDVEFSEGRAFVVIDEPRLYNVYRGEFGRHLLELKSEDTDFRFSAFTFG